MSLLGGTSSGKDCDVITERLGTMIDVPPALVMFTEPIVTLLEPLARGPKTKRSLKDPVIVDPRTLVTTVPCGELTLGSTKMMASSSPIQAVVSVARAKKRAVRRDKRAVDMMSTINQGGGEMMPLSRALSHPSTIPVGPFDVRTILNSTRRFFSYAAALLPGSIGQ